MDIRDLSADEVHNLPTLGLDDTFNFSCIACGRCCKNRHDILLTPYDLYRISSHLGRTPQEVFDRYCEVYEGDQSRFPVVRLLPVPPYSACPFLRGKRCSVHSQKPVVCRVYPLARMTGDESGARFVMSGASCSHNPQPITVREWIADVASEEAENAGSLWWKAVISILSLIQPDKFPSGVRKQLLAFIFTVLWLDYDMSKPFAEQLQANVTQIQELISSLNCGAKWAAK